MKRMLSVLFVLMILICGLRAQVDINKPPAPGPAPEIKIGEYESFELKNDLQVFVIENHKMPRIAIAIAFRTDPVMQGPNAGYSQLTGELLRTGTTKRSKAQLDEEIDFIGATLTTSSDLIYAASLKKHMNTLLDLVADVTLNAKFNQDELDKLRKRVLSGLAFSKDQPNMIANRIRKILNYGKKHPYGEILTEKSVKSVTLEMCENYYKTYFSPDHAYLAVVGDVTVKEIKPLITKYFSGWKKVDVPFHQYKLPKPPESRIVALVDRPNAVQSNIMVTYPIRLKLGSRDQVKTEILNNILGGTSTARLFMNLREDKGFTYGAYSTLEADPLVGYFSAGTEVGNSVTDSAITEILNEMSIIQNDIVDEKSLQASKNYLTGVFSRSLEDPQTIATFALNVERYWMPKDYYNNYLKNIEAVTTADVQAMAKKYIKPDKANILVVGKAEEIHEKIRPFSADNKILFFKPEGNRYDPEAFKPPKGISAQSIIDKYIQSIGGRKNLATIKDITMKAQTGSRGRTATVTFLQKAPNKYCRIEEFGSLRGKTVYDGQRGVKSGMGQTVEVIGNDLEELKFEAEINSILKLDQFWIETELVGEEKLDDQDTYLVRFKPRIGRSWLVYYDKKTGLEVRSEKYIETPQGGVTVVVELDDYRLVEGVKFPFSYIITTGNIKQVLNVLYININAGIDDSEFKINF